MGGSRSFFIESKLFQLVIEEGGRYFSLWIFEWGKYFLKSFLMGKSATQWLIKSIKHTIVGVSSKRFFTIRDRDIAYTLQRSSNSFGQYLLLTELKVGGFRRFVIIPKGNAKNGRRVFGLGIRKMLEPNQYAMGVSSHSKFIAQPLKTLSFKFLFSLLIQ